MGIQTDDFAAPPGNTGPRVVSAARQSPQEEAQERALRPKLLADYIGQAKAREQLEIFIGAARKRDEAEAAPEPLPGPHHRGGRRRGRAACH